MLDLDNWHNDGDFFVHFLDSPEQALLVIPLWSDIESKGGGTAICGEGIKHIAKHLVHCRAPISAFPRLTLYQYDHPEGTNPWMTSTLDPSHSTHEGLGYCEYKLNPISRTLTNISPIQSGYETRTTQR